MTAPSPQLRSYPRNSPQAAARIVALAPIANGRVKTVEIAALDALGALGRLGVTRPRWQAVIGELCADLLHGADFQVRPRGSAANASFRLRLR
jgi:hypothetical protein